MDSKFLRNKVVIKQSKKPLIVLLLLISIFIGCLNKDFRGLITDKMFNSNFKFAKVNEWYNKYLGGILPFKDLIKDPTKKVFNEKLTYADSSIYLDGCSLIVDNGYLIPVIESGLVVYVGEKDGYNKTVIIQQVNGVDTWYGNIDTSNVKLYDYVEKGTILGNTSDDKLFLVFQSEGKFLDFNEYI